MRKTSSMFYHGTKEEVRVGDRVRMRRWLRADRFGVVCYIPGLSPRHRELGDDQWAIRDDDAETTWAMAYDPVHAQPSPRITLVARGDTGALDPDERIDERETDSPDEPDE